MNVGARPKVKRPKKTKGLEIAREQYQRLQEELHSTLDVRQRNTIYRRLINLLDVMDFLNSPPSGVSY